MAVFRACYTKNIRSEHVHEATPDGTDVYVVGDLIFFDTATQTLKKCGADPSLIAAVSELVSANSGTLTENGMVPYRQLQSDDIVAMCGTSDPAVTNIGVAYGVVNTGGVWKVDLTDTSNTRVVPVGIDTGTGTFYVQFLAANLQFDAVAS